MPTAACSLAYLELDSSFPAPCPASHQCFLESPPKGTSLIPVSGSASGEPNSAAKIINTQNHLFQVYRDFQSEITSAPGSVPAATPGDRQSLHIADGETEAQRKAVIHSRTHHHQGEGLKLRCPYPKISTLSCSGLPEGPELARRVVSCPLD